MNVLRALFPLAAALALTVVAPAALGQPAPQPATQPPSAPEGLRVVFCGTSGPLPVIGRAKPCTAIQAGGALYIVDIGAEATENLMLWRLPLGTTRAVFLTHLHSDHIGEVGEFNLQSWVAGRSAPLPLVGPRGVEKVARGFNEAYELDHTYRKAHHEHGPYKFSLSAAKLEAKAVAADGKPAVAWRDGDLTVTAIPVAHEPVTPAFAYRFDYKGRSVVISGDTRKWQPLAEAAKGADLLIHEGQSPDMMRQLAGGLGVMGNPRMASLITDTLTYHTSPAEAAEIARSAGVKALIISHITQAGLPFFTPDAFAKGVAEGGPLDWRLAKDGMVVDLPADSAEMRFSSY
ncbi:MBL fold metallo-hydrolase [Phenylobacterium sp. VNQ135]|uniref:MBL fold metallo-hydrolase n=1 Tax=Phenylobacterium sp. VNQ135 TaxID=3400922 RepID=UPI003C00DA31